MGKVRWLPLCQQDLGPLGVNKAEFKCSEIVILTTYMSAVTF